MFVIKLSSVISWSIENKGVNKDRMTQNSVQSTTKCDNTNLIILNFSHHKFVKSILEQFRNNLQTWPQDGSRRRDILCVLRFQDCNVYDVIC